MNYIDVPQPEPTEDEVLIKVDTVGICGSELEGYLGHNSLRKPLLLMGHEFAGTIERTGSAAAGFVRGQRVVVNPLSSCGTCAQCHKGLYQLCSGRTIIGIHRPGAFAEYVTAPAAGVYVLPEHLPFETAVLTEPLACSLRAARRAMEGHAFANVAVIGAGAIGLLTAMSARILGASRLFVLDVNAARLETVRKLEVGIPIDSSKPDAEEELKRLSGDKGIDVIIDAAGFQQTRSLAARLVNSGGDIMNIGLGIDGTVLPINQFIRAEVDVKGSFCYTRQDFQDALDLLSAGKVSEAGWTEIRPLSEGPRSFHELVNGQVAAGKIILKP